ncbi:hypothetical protein HYN59_00815 [Flavobacterium album]|uniref:Lipocalin-like domain-containing protein n=1 Tax=Flavobacterium album TaxID=2175091 RepID=A0A2S1QTP3_9FLAO|nr:hypothetical protein [Flavobacterium album]AWH83744.1 hypothetical protein HYN59_00815 [Flavobacterium album]
MKRVLLLLVFLPVISFSQELAGKWSEARSPNKTIEFRGDGVLELGEIGQPRRTTGRSFTKYSTTTVNGISYILFEYHLEGHSPDSERCRYIINGDKLTIFCSVLNYQNIRTSPYRYKIVECTYTRIK